MGNFNEHHWGDSVSVITWTPDRWQLSFVVQRNGRIIGVQTLEAADFKVSRTVDSSSHLIASHRGLGFGKQLRRAILALAFGPLTARRAITSAWHDNHASLAVSRAVGYQITGQTDEPADSRPGTNTMVHLELTQAQWEQSGQSAEIHIEGFAGCTPYFGL